MEKILDCFLEKGAILNDIGIEPNVLKYRPLAVYLLAKKSILHLEGMSLRAILPGVVGPAEPEIYPFFTDAFNAITVMILKGKICGTVDLNDLHEIHAVLQRYMTPTLPDKFLPLETLYEMTGQAPTLQQLARREIWKKLAHSGNVSRERIQRLGEEFLLPRVLMDYVQADDLGLEVDAIMAHMQYSPDVE